MKTTVPLFKQEIIKAKTEQLNKLAARHGFQPISLQWGAKTTMTVWTKDDVGREFETEVEAIHLTVEAPVWSLPGGWRLLAVLEHGSGDVIIRAAGEQPDGKLARWHGAESYCEVCHTRRRRNKTIIIEDENGKQMQVGTSCVRPFLGIDPEAVLSMTANYIALIDIIDDDDFDLKQVRETEVLNPLDVLSMAVHIINEAGYTSRRKATMYEHPTANFVEAALISYDGWGKPSEDEENRAAQVLNWMTNIPSDDAVQNDYLYNLKALASREYWKFEHIGLATSAVAAYMRREAEKAEQAARPSNWVGEVKQRLTFHLTYKRLAFASDSRCGVTFGHVFEDAQGNIFFWTTSNNGFFDADGGWVEFEPGMQLTMKATIKAHETYRDVKQTIITRCKVIEAC